METTTAMTSEIQPITGPWPTLKQTPKSEKIAILDCGAQYTKVIDRRIRELNVETEILPLNTSLEPFKAGEYGGIIISGGPGSVYETNAPKPQEGLFDLDLPILGICYGMQLMNHACGGDVQPGTTKEYGETTIQIATEHPFFLNLSADQQVLMSHGDQITTLAPVFHLAGQSEQGGQTIPAVMIHETRPLIGVQFHPEVDISENGVEMLRRFVFDVCGLRGTFSLKDRLPQMISAIQQQAGERNVVVLVSGGVDSSVTAALLLKALGPERVYAVHVDSGFMRQDESDLVCKALEAIGLKHLQRINAEEDFLNGTTEWTENGISQNIGPLSKTTDPEHKRRIIGDVFYHITQKTIADLNLDMDNTLIAQGTLRPDLIESGNTEISSHAHKIKTHHNDVPLIQSHREKGLIIEPNRDLHKDEVREIGRMLGLPESLVIRQPFPGPGLAIRILCAEEPFLDDAFLSTNEKLQKLLLPYGYRSVLLPIRSVGVQGDGRSYQWAAAIQPLQSPKQYPKNEAFYAELFSLAQTITNQIQRINRVILSLSESPLPKVCQAVTPTHLNAETTRWLRQVDHTVNATLSSLPRFSAISQLLSVAIPIDFESHQRHSVVIRGVMTADFMTARPSKIGADLPEDVLKQLAQSLESDFEAAHVFYDLTSKPPATVEWE